MGWLRPGQWAAGVAVAGLADVHLVPLVAARKSRKPHSPSDPKTPVFFLCQTRRSAKGCIGDGTWYGVVTAEAHQQASRVCAGDTRFLREVFDLHLLVLAKDAKSCQTTTANVLDRTKFSSMRLFAGRNLVVDFAVFGSSTVTEPHLATATRV